MKRFLIFTIVALLSISCSAEFLKQSTAVILKLGPFIDDTDFKTVEPSLTISQVDIQISKAGAAFAQT